MQCKATRQNKQEIKAFLILQENVASMKTKRIFSANAL